MAHQPEAAREWTMRRPPSPWELLPLLKASPGVTALAGRALRLNGRPLADVTFEIAGYRARSDRSGRFLLIVGNGTSGRHEVFIDGRTANRPGVTYGTFEVGVPLVAGATTAMSYTVWMSPIDTAYAVRIPSPTTAEVVITTPRVPGLELHLPPNTVIRDHDGNVVREVSLTPLPVDRPPFPMPDGVDVPVYFTIQPGGAYVHVGYGPNRRGAYVVYPNRYRAAPGSPANFWHYDPKVRGWDLYGWGEVAANGKQVYLSPMSLCTSSPVLCLLT